MAIVDADSLSRRIEVPSGATWVPRGLVLFSLNNRRHFEGIRELAEEIERDGLIQLPLFRAIEPTSDGKVYQCVAGERRCKAMDYLELEEYPCSIRELDDREAMLLMLKENGQRADTNPIEKADGFRRAMDNGCTAEEVAATEGWKSTSPMYKRLALLGLSSYLQGEVAEGLLGVEPGAALSRRTQPIEPEEERLQCQDSIYRQLAATGQVTLSAVEAACDAVVPTLLQEGFDFGDNLNDESTFVADTVAKLADTSELRDPDDGPWPLDGLRGAELYEAQADRWEGESLRWRAKGKTAPAQRCELEAAALRRLAALVEADDHTFGTSDRISVEMSLIQRLAASGFELDALRAALGGGQ